MPASSAVAPVVVPNALLNEPPPCQQAEAMREQAAAINRLADVFEKGFQNLAPAAETVHGFGARLDALCTWLKRKGPWLLCSIPVVLTSINAVSPEAAKRLGTFLSALLGQ